MSFYYANARQPEILRTVQKDETFTNQIGQNLSDTLRFTNTKLWIKYNHLCTLLAELSYHGFASWNNLQTLGEEYTGIIQIDNKYITLPSKFLQLLTIVMEYASERFLIKLIRNVEHQIEQNTNLLPAARQNALKCCAFIMATIPYVQAMHRTWFYLYGGKYQIARRITGINYVLIRYWMNVKHSVYGYKVLGILSSLQLALVFAAFVKQTIQSQCPTDNASSTQRLNNIRKRMTSENKSKRQSNSTVDVQCILCLEKRNNTSATICGHLFCWSCILDWLDQKEECPVCRDPITKSTIVCLRNVKRIE